ncbi:MAG TPA: CBS domain-containing protein [Gemmatimonadaceae bacterium]|nr:CBS domain-containing protein [Gemmatimonadaceae bacterium]
MQRLRDIMTTDVVTVTPETTIREAMELFASRHISGAPVVSGRKVVGVVSATDLMSLASALPNVPDDQVAVAEWEPPSELPGRYFSELSSEDSDRDVQQRFAETAGSERSMLDDLTVSDAMTRATYSLPPDAEITRAADFMQRVHAHRILVMQDDELVGIVSAMDVTKAVAEHRLSTRTYVFNRDEEFDERGWE